VAAKAEVEGSAKVRNPRTATGNADLRALKDFMGKFSSY